jgi:hypothetical protein
MKNMRERKRRKRPSHPDFLWMMSSSHPSRSISTNPKRYRRFKNYLANLKEFDPGFGVLRWGDIGRIEDVRENTNAHIIWVKDISEHGEVENILRDIDFPNEILQYWIGAPSVLVEDFVKVYEKKREEWVRDKRLNL